MAVESKPDRESTKYPYFSENTSEEVVNSRMASTIDSRLDEIMRVIVKHLHGAVKELQPTQDEWMAAINFLTDVGHMCTDWRQEFILLSDTLGVSMLVDAINHRRPNGATENTILGPFYVPQSPRYELGANICLDDKGKPLLVEGRIIDTSNKPVPRATLDVWQASEDGFYDVQQKGVQPDFNLRGVLTSNSEGRYWFRSVKPRYYPIPDDGPVGRMLAALGRHPYRAAHIHFIITAAGFEPVITHIFAPDCEYLSEDAVFGVKESLVGDFRLVSDQAMMDRYGFAEPFWHVNRDFTLAAENPRAATRRATRG
jgi:hydroxyquinol 1,2-dioxygenase